jgi:MAternally-affected-uncoordination protein
MQIVDWLNRFPTILQGCETTIQTLLGHYAHSVGCFNEAAMHFLEAAKVIEDI